MSRARLKAGRTPAEIGDAIVGAWYAVLPNVQGGAIGQIDVASLTAALSNIIDSTVRVVLDDATTTHIVVPYIFDVVQTRPELSTYLHDHYANSYATSAAGDRNPFNPHNRRKQRQRTFGEDMGEALFFGCGR